MAMLLLAADATAFAAGWERIQADFRSALADLSGRIGEDWRPNLPAPGAPAASPGAPRVVVVGFTGGLEPKGFQDSGIATVIRRIAGPDVWYSTSMKVGIVGARLAGSYAALILSRLGHEVLLLDPSTGGEKASRFRRAVKG